MTQSIIIVDVEQSSTFISDIGDGPPLIFIHALGLNTAMWTLQVPPFAKRYKVIRYDVRGHGLTPFQGEPISISTLAADLLALMDRLELERASLIGLSMGGMIAQAFAASHPDRVFALGLISTVSVFSDVARAGLRERALTVERDGMEPMVAPAVERWFTESFRARGRANPSPQDAAGGFKPGTDIYEANIIAAIGQMIAKADPMGYAAVCRALANADLTPDLYKITCPTLIMSGQQDPAINSQSQDILKANIANNTKIVIPDCSHLVAMERATDFNSHLLNFLARCGYT